MLNRKFRWYIALTIAIGLVLIHGRGIAYDITDKISIGGVLSGAYQYQSGDDIDDKGRGTLPFQPEISFRPSGQDEIFAKFGFAYLNGADDGDFDYTRVAEVYWRFVLNEYFAATADLQYMADEFDTAEEDSDGFIMGICGTVEF